MVSPVHNEFYGIYFYPVSHLQFIFKFDHGYVSFITPYKITVK